MCASAQAADLSNGVAIHGYGHRLLPQRRRRQLGRQFGLHPFRCRPDERSKVCLQLHNTAEVSHLDWGYVDSRHNSHVTLRGGQIKLPFGLYNEIIDARFLQQSTLPPLLYQEGAGFTDENSRGANVSITHDVDAGSLTWTGYVGEVARSPETPDTTQFHSLAGLNVIYQTPVEGLRLMASGYRSHVEEIDTNLAASGSGNRAAGALSTGRLARCRSTMSAKNGT